MIENRHAYLIVAHANPYVLERLIRLIDDERNDIYLHIDKKSKNFDFAYFQQLPQKSKLHYTNRVDVRWGHVSLIEAEMTLFRTAYGNGEYSYFHLISGVDLPLKSQNFIHRFMQENNGTEFIGFSDDYFDKNNISRIHLFPKHMRVEEKDYLGRVLRRVRQWFLKLQGLVGYDRTKGKVNELVRGSNWASVTSDFVKRLVEQESEILKFYKYANCGDEVYKQTLLYTTEFRNRAYDLKDELKGCMRFMDWHRGRPYSFRKEDFALIMDSGMLFARKFEDACDKEVVDLIYHSVKHEQ